MSGNDLQPVDVTGETLEEAIKSGLEQLGLARNEVIIEIIEEGSKGLLGMGAREALVRLIPLRSPRPPLPERPTIPEPQPEPEKPEPQPEPAQEVRPTPPPQPQPTPVAQPAAPAPREQDEDDDDEDEDRGSYDERTVDAEVEAKIANDALRELLEHLDIKASIKMRQGQPASDGRDEETPWVLNIKGRDLGILIGRRGETLNALQFITRLIVSRELQQRASFVIDVEGYKLRRENTLRTLARRMAEQARSQGRTLTLEPMPPNERRIIHLTLREDRTVRTESVGSGDGRKVTIIPVD